MKKISLRTLILLGILALSLLITATGASAQEDTCAFQAGDSVKVTVATGVYLREFPTTDAPAVAKLVQNVIFEVSDTRHMGNRCWLEATVEGYTGWVSANRNATMFVEIAEEAAPEEPDNDTVGANGDEFLALIQSTTVATHPSDLIQILDESFESEWYRFEADNGSGAWTASEADNGYMLNAGNDYIVFWSNLHNTDLSDNDNVEPWVVEGMYGVFLIRGGQYKMSDQSAGGRWVRIVLTDDLRAELSDESE